MTIVKELFGKTNDGHIVDIFTLTNKNKIKIKITNFGGTIISLEIPDKSGAFDDIILGNDNIENLEIQSEFFGALVGRFANRIDNGMFTLNNKQYKVPQNDGTNSLHGGLKGFDKVVWKAEIKNDGNKEYLELCYISKDGEEGYPGNLSVRVNYSLNDNNELKIEYFATTDKDTIINLTNHAYFNLSGHDSEDILNHEIMIKASRFTPVNNNLIPIGEIASVLNTPMDFTKSIKIGARIKDSYEQLQIAGGYDHNWVFDEIENTSEVKVELFDPKSGRIMEVYTSMPGIQLYTGNFLDGKGCHKNGISYGKNSGLCIETQNFPDAINHSNFPSPILREGEKFNHFTIFKFVIK